MLFHHDGRTYEEAASDAARHARGLMEKEIERGQTKGAELIEQILAETPKDYMVRGNRLRFDFPDDGAAAVAMGDHRFEIGKHAFGQVADRAGVPLPYARKLADGEAWRRDLLSDILQETYSQTNDRYLARTVGETMRGFLSKRYRRIDSRPLVEAFAQACAATGLVPVDGMGSETRWHLKAMLPRIFEPVPNEVLAFGFTWQNSDYGHGKHVLAMFALRLWCTNYGVMRDELSNVHLGRELPDDIELSQETYRLDTAANVSALRDVVKDGLRPERVGKICDAIKQADEQKMTWQAARSAIGSALNKGELEAVKGAFDGESDLMALPQGEKSRWRLSNALSWVANKAGDANRRMDLQHLAGRVAGVN